MTGYDSVAVTKPDTTLTDEEFEAELARVMDAHGTVETVEEDRELHDGDWAEIEFKGEIQELATTVGEEKPNDRADHGRGCADRSGREEYADGVHGGFAREEGWAGDDV